jgi:hypothetical protein
MQKTFLLILFFSAFLTGKAQSTVDSLMHVKNGQFRIGPSGFPEQIFALSPADSLLAENIHFHFTRQSDGKDIRLKNEGWQLIKKKSGTIEWVSVLSADELRVDINASLKEETGLLSYTVKVTALADLDMKNIVMHIPFRKEMAGYLSGLGVTYGVRSDSMLVWKWPGAPKTAGVWIGDARVGLQYALEGAQTWANEGKGSISVGIKGKSMLASNDSGPCHLTKGDTRWYGFNLRITPSGRIASSASPLSHP